MATRLIESFATTGSLSDLFSDSSILQALLDFEIALARVEARLGVIPKSAAEAIAAAAKVEALDTAALAHAAQRAGTFGIPIAKALTEKVRARDPEAARFVHWGATSQDVSDTALVLLFKRARSLLDSDLARLEAALRRLAEQHADTVMLGRTLLQAAPPVTFGLKAGGWLGALQRDRSRLDAAFSDARVVQFGGASGTLASLGEKGPSVAQELAKELQLGCPEAPWHTHRDRLAAVVCACGVLIGSLGKMARDVSLLMQGEIAEVSEPGGDARGGSSTMPQKRNPVGCALTLAAANRVPGLVAAFLAGMVQEHERAVGGWQAEWPTIAGVLQSTGLAIASMAEVAEGLGVDAKRMRSNIEATEGTVFAEKAMMLLGSRLGRDVAHKLLEEASRRSLSEHRRLSEVLGDMPEIKNHLDRATLEQLENPEQYLGAAERFRTSLLASKKNTRGKKE